MPPSRAQRRVSRAVPRRFGGQGCVVGNGGSGMTIRAIESVARRVDAQPWDDVERGLDGIGLADAGPVLDPPECRELTDMYDDDSRFRSTIDMARHRFGEGQYRYFGSPLPELVQELRAAFWPHL